MVRIGPQCLLVDKIWPSIEETAGFSPGSRVIAERHNGAPLLPKGQGPEQRPKTNNGDVCYRTGRKTTDDEPAESGTSMLCS